jgi:hypothetical protein
MLMLHVAMGIDVRDYSSNRFAGMFKSNKY